MAPVRGRQRTARLGAAHGRRGPHAVFWLYEGKTHFDLLDNRDEMFANLVPKWDGEPSYARAGRNDGIW
ncbi:hypothetical protein CMQ_2526 [Grosmannia clavigera kw1407]|uniref:Uncharacterized protein n=1 Tax=Grosmannia clavigera (strain kw1407 / UAMH 11150) TaxID=655863 RepID=F0XGE5_GROCL|nr:uncharacterized protein CMQ_2526 [Grosmannia clavigera kw1407]EFX02597.1 hypothetical protein CMQ_2526 [Grosmannia clavigera kw1407]